MVWWWGESEIGRGRSWVVFKYTSDGPCGGRLLPKCSHSMSFTSLHFTDFCHEAGLNLAHCPDAASFTNAPTAVTALHHVMATKLGSA